MNNEIVTQRLTTSGIPTRAGGRLKDDIIDPFCATTSAQVGIRMRNDALVSILTSILYTL